MTRTLRTAVVSAGRPASIERMTALLAGLDPTWFVPAAELADYQYVATGLGIPFSAFAVEPGEGEQLAVQRNAVLEWAGDDTAVQFNDDLAPSKRTRTGFTFTTDGDTEKVITAAEAVALICDAMDQVGARFGGCAPTTNKFFYSAGRPIGTKHFIMAQLMVIDPTDLRFDTTFGTKEDYDFGLQHLYRFGTVARADGVLGNFKHFETRGGCGPYRTVEYDTRMARQLVAKWPNDVKINARRGDHEVLMRWSGAREDES